MQPGVPCGPRLGRLGQHGRFLAPSKPDQCRKCTNKATAVKTVCGNAPLKNRERRSAKQTTLRLAGVSLDGPNFGELLHTTQKSLGRAYLSLLPGPWQYAPSFLIPAATLLSIGGATHGHVAVLYALHQLPMATVMEWLPAAREVERFYRNETQLCNLAFDTLLSLVCALGVFLGLPAGDMVLGLDPREPSQDKGEDSSNDSTYRSILYANVVLHWALLLVACSAAGQDMHVLPFLGMTVSMGVEGSLLFVITHELLHSHSSNDRLLASFGLAPLAYMHWTCSHLSHHRKVATPEDPASAAMGESLYSFVPRSVVGNMVDGLASEHRRMAALGLPPYSPRSRVWWWTAAPVGLLALVTAVFGPWASGLAIGQALVAIFMLEVVNFVEHYGLRRSQLPSGRYEKVDITHSWNANWLLTNSVIFSLQRHSDHHANSAMPYQKLRNIPEAPQLPASYPAMMLLALAPPAFFRVMNPRVAMYTAAKGTRTSNLQS